jgi:hypothetical protein
MRAGRLAARLRSVPGGGGCHQGVGTQGLMPSPAALTLPNAASACAPAKVRQGFIGSEGTDFTPMQRVSEPHAARAAASEPKGCRGTPREAASEGWAS